MKALTFDIVLEQAVLVSKTSSGEENSLESYDFIPGSALRGAIIGLYLRNNPGINISLDPQCQKWFFSGQHTFLNGYPINPNDGKRMLPNPLSWRVEKDEKALDDVRIKDFAVEVDQKIKSPVLPGPGYTYFLNANNCIMKGVDRLLIPHNASLNRQIKRANDSFVFLYDVLAPDQTFSSAIVGDEVDDLKKKLDLKDDLILFIGGSSSANYGRVKINNLIINPDWREYNQSTNINNEKTIITLLSDSIFYDEYGNSSTDPYSYFGSHPEKSYFKTRIVSGFNRKWGLPLPQSIATMAGSVFVFDSKDFDQLAIQKLSVLGVGSRTCEGFGRIAINWNTIPSIRRKPIDLSKPQIVPKITLSSDSKDLAKQLLKRKIEDILENKLLDAIKITNIKNPPSRAQLSQLRQKAKNSVIQENLSLIIDYCNGLKSNAERQFQSARVKYGLNPEIRLLEWMKQGLVDDFKDDNHFWKYLDPGQITLAGETIDQTQMNSIKAKYTARFIEGLARKTIRETQKEIQMEERG